MSNRKKKILTLSDLENFYSKYKRSTTFSSKKSGYQLAVQVPATFEIDEDNDDDTLLFCKSRIFHIGENRNRSNVTEEAAKKAMKTMAYKPLLANFAEFTDDEGNTFVDFTSHDMVIENDKIKYLERQIGCITADEPWFEEYKGKTYVCGYLAIPKDYTEAVDIIERKNGTKVSVELLINELSYDAKNHSMLLTDVVVSGLTCLGRNPETGEEVQEGMINSRLDIADFSREKNSIIDFSEKEIINSKLIDTLERLNSTLLSNFNINKETNDNKTNDVSNSETQNFSENEEKGGNEKLTKFEELLNKYNKTQEDITFEVEGLSDEELEAKFAEMFEDDSDSSEGSEDGDISTTSEEGVETSMSEETVEEAEAQTDPEDDIEDKPEEIETQACGDDKKKNYSKTFELSHDDIRCAIYNLLSAYLDEEDFWCAWVVEVFDNHFIYQVGNDFYGCNYIKDDKTDTVALSGEPYKVYAEFLTEEEKAQVEDMRSNYSSIQTELNSYKEAELQSQREAVFNDEAYAEFIETDNFKKIKENINTYSVDELRTACDLAFAKEVKVKGTFALNTKNEDEKKSAPFFAFARNEEKSSFLDGLLKK